MFERPASLELTKCHSSSIAHVWRLVSSGGLLSAATVVLKRENNWNNSSITLVEAAKAHSRSFVISEFSQGVANSPVSSKLRSILSNLFQLMAVSWILEDPLLQPPSGHHTQALLGPGVKHITLRARLGVLKRSFARTTCIYVKLNICTFMKRKHATFHFFRSKALIEGFLASFTNLS